MTDKANKRDRADRFAYPEGPESAKLNYFDDKGNRLSASAWLEDVKEKAASKKLQSDPQ